MCRLPWEKTWECKPDRGNDYRDIRPPVRLGRDPGVRPAPRFRLGCPACGTMTTAAAQRLNRLPICSFASRFLVTPVGTDPSNGTASERIGKDADYNRLSMKHGSATSARRAVSALFAGNGFAFGVWSAHISVFKQNYGLSNAQLTIPLFALALGAILSMPVIGRVFHRFDSSGIAWKGQICYAVALSLLPWTKSLTWLAIGTFGFGVLRGMVDVSTNTQAIITERAYGSAVLSSLQGFWSLGGVIGAAFSSVLLRQHATARARPGRCRRCHDRNRSGEQALSA